MTIGEGKEGGGGETYLDAIRLDSDESVKLSIPIPISKHTTQLQVLRSSGEATTTATYVCSVVILAADCSFALWRSMLCLRRALSLGPRWEKIGGSGLEEGGEEEGESGADMGPGKIISSCWPGRWWGAESGGPPVHNSSHWLHKSCAKPCAALVLQG